MEITFFFLGMVAATMLMPLMESMMCSVGMWATVSSGKKK
jgi:hypothetical protein